MLQIFIKFFCKFVLVYLFAAHFVPICYADTDKSELVPADTANKLIKEALAGESSHLPDRSIVENYEFQSQLAISIIKTLKTSLIDKPLSYSLPLKSLVNDVIPKENAALNKINKMFERAEEIERLVASGDEVRLLDMYKMGLPKDELAILDLGVSKLTEAKLSKTILENTEESYLDMLLLLANPNYKIISTKIIDYANEALTKLITNYDTQQNKDSLSSIMCNRSFSDLLRKLDQSIDSKSTSRIVDILQSSILNYVNQDNGEKAQMCMEALISYRSDPNRLNDNLRKKIILNPHAENVVNFTIAQIDKLRKSGKFTILLRLRLMLSAWYYTSFASISTASMGFLFIFLISFLIRNLTGEETSLNSKSDEELVKEFNLDPDYLATDREAKLRQLRKKHKRSAYSKSFKKLRTSLGKFSGKSIETRVHRERRTGWGGSSDETNSSKKNKARIFGHRKQTPIEDEYSKLLKVFGLSDEATEEEIVERYRFLLRTYHPDAQGDELPKDIDVMGEDYSKFIKDFDSINDVHKRIIEIRSRMFHTK